MKGVEMPLNVPHGSYSAVQVAESLRLYVGELLII